ncbi:MAG: DUF1499 domain-containing protein [Sphingorhabdus sp.]
MTEDTANVTEEAAVVDTPMDNSPIAAPAKVSSWAGKLVLALALIAAFIGLAGPVGAGWGLWDWQAGLGSLRYSFYLAVFALVLGLFVGWLNKKRGINATKSFRIMGMIVALGYAGWMLSWVYTARSVPAIHDISTDLADPPQFRMLALRTDNLDDVPGADDPEMKGLNPQQRWESLHRKAYGDVRTVRINELVVDVVAKAERLAKARDWNVAIADPIEGRIEATATTALFRFKDDVVLRVRPSEDGKGSVVDMRSVSRVGVSDLGANAKRVRAFLADLSGTVTAG